MDIVDLPDTSGGFFKAASFEDADALLVEVLMFEPNRQDEYKGHVDTIHANVTVFKDGQEPVTHTGVLINNNGLTRKLRSIVGSATIQALGKAPTKKGHDAWVWQEPEPQAKKRVLDWVAALEEVAAEAPGFDD